MILGGLQKLTLIDYPGKLAATVFTVGCNFRCPFCYNAELVLPEKIKNHPKISEDDFFSFLEERKGFLEGVCITGGEPTLHRDLPDFIRKIKDQEYLVKLDTNGSNPKMLKKLISNTLIDYVAMDIKGPKEKYKKIAGPGLNLKNIEESINILKDCKIDYEFRTTIIPDLHNKEDIIGITHWLGGGKNYYLQQFRPEKTLDSKFETKKPHKDKKLVEILNSVAPFFENCQLRC